MVHMAMVEMRDGKCTECDRRMDFTRTLSDGRIVCKWCCKRILGIHIQVTERTHGWLRMLEPVAVKRPTEDDTFVLYTDTRFKHSKHPVWVIAKNGSYEYSTTDLSYWRNIRLQSPE